MNSKIPTNLHIVKSPTKQPRAVSPVIELNCDWLSDPAAWDKENFTTDIVTFIEQTQGVNAYPNMVLIGTWQSDGSVLVRAVVESEAVLTAALASHYSTIKQAAIAQAQEQKQVDVAAAKQTAIDTAVATASVTA